MLTPPDTPVATSSLCGSSSAIQTRPASIFAAASLMAYKIPITIQNGAVPTLSRMIDDAKSQQTPLTADFRIHHDPVSPSIHQKRVARIYIPDEVHEANHEAWKQVWKLRKRLISMYGPAGLEVEWAPCKANDRAQSCRWKIWSGDEKEPKLNIRVTDKHYRLAILNTAIVRAGLLASTHIWYEHHNVQENSPTHRPIGHVQLASPQDVWKLVAFTPGPEGIPIIFDGRAYRLSFSLIDYHIQPSSPATIAAELRDPGPRSHR